MMSSSNSDWLELLRPSAVTALSRLRKRLNDSPDLTVLEARRLLSTTYDNAGFDFHRAVRLHELLPVDLVETQAIFRATISEVLGRACPPWTALLRSGRSALLGLDPDTLTCFERAGAFEPVPDPEVLDWWDKLAAKAYVDADQSRCLIGREAERRSLEHERRLLVDIPGAPPPKWKALDSNSAGYDIQSSLLKDDLVQPKLIEVKGSTRLPVTFHLTRNEWQTAIRNRGTYFFQVWQLATDVMVELSVKDVEEHVPVDRGRGEWREALIEISMS